MWLTDFRGGAGVGDGLLEVLCLCGGGVHMNVLWIMGVRGFGVDIRGFCGCWLWFVSVLLIGLCHG